MPAALSPYNVRLLGRPRGADLDGAGADGQAEVDDLHLPTAVFLAHQDVIRLQIAVQDVLAMSRPHGLGDLPGDREEVFQRQHDLRPELFQVGLEADAREVIHDDIGMRLGVVGEVAVLHADDRGVLAGDRGRRLVRLGDAALRIGETAESRRPARPVVRVRVARREETGLLRLTQLAQARPAELLVGAGEAVGVLGQEGFDLFVKRAACAR